MIIENSLSIPTRFVCILRYWIISYLMHIAQLTYLSWTGLFLSHDMIIYWNSLPISRFHKNRLSKGRRCFNKPKISMFYKTRYTGWFFNIVYHKIFKKELNQRLNVWKNWLNFRIPFTSGFTRNSFNFHFSNINTYCTFQNGNTDRI